MASALRLLACLALCFAAAVVGAWVTNPQIPTWYATLEKPPWTPPNWVFPVAWNTLYTLMAISLWLLWERARKGDPGAHRSIFFFLVQLALNGLWSPVFFGLHAPVAALAIIVALIVVLGVTINTARHVSRTAALLLVPYFAWLLYAASLNGAIAVLN